jgi:dCMP deaminase
MTRPGRTEILMRQAEIVATRSTCTRAHVGVVIAHDGRVVSQGYNGAPAGMQHCDHTCSCGGRGPAPVCSDQCRYLLAGGWHDSFCVFEKWTNKARHVSGCPAYDPCTVAVHAEANAIAFAARHGVATNGAALYTTLWPCLTCAQLIINAGISRVYMLNEYRDDSGVALLRRSSVGVAPWSFPR